MVWLYKVNKYGQKWETFFYMDWSTLSLELLVLLPVLTKNLNIHSSLRTLERLLTSVPCTYMLFMQLPVFTVPFVRKRNPCFWHKEEFSPSYLYIPLTRVVVLLYWGFSFFSQMCQGCLPPPPPPLDAPAVAPHLLLISHPDRGALKRHEAAAFTWSDGKCVDWSRVCSSSLINANNPSECRAGTMKTPQRVDTSALVDWE